MSYYRKQRGKSQKIFLITQELIENPTDQEDQVSHQGLFTVAGTTGNVYTVKIQEEPSCTCPDFTIRHNRCKHIYFILIRIMKVKPIHEDRAKFSNSRLQKMFQRMGETCQALQVTEEQRQAYLKAAQTNEDGTVQMKPLDDVCLICYDPLDNGEQITFCQYSCGKPIHQECLQEWHAHQAHRNCLFCQRSYDPPSQEKKYFNLHSKFKTLGTGEEFPVEEEDEYMVF